MKRISDKYKTTGTLIKRCHLFSNLNELSANEIAPHFKLVKWDKGSHINEKTLTNNFFILIQGRIEMMRINPDTGRSVTLDLIQVGDGLDIITLLDGKPREMLFSPVEDLRLISVPINKMREWIWKYPALNQKLMPYIANKMREQEDNITSFALSDTITRLSRILLKNLNYKNNYEGTEKDSHKEYLVCGPSDEILARMVGSVRQVVNKHLQHWKQDDTINKSRNLIRINDLQALFDEAGYTMSHYHQLMHLA